MMEYPNIIVKSHVGTVHVTYDVYTREEIRIIESNISVLSNNDIKNYINKLLKKYNTMLKELTEAQTSNKSKTNPDFIEAKLDYVKTVIGYLNKRLEPYIDETNEVKTELNGISHIITEDNYKYRINENIKLIELIRLIYCINKESKFGRVLLTKDMVKLITEKFIWKEEIKSKTVKSYFNQLNNDVRLERSKLSKDIWTIDEAVFIDLINGLI